MGVFLRYRIVFITAFFAALGSLTAMLVNAGELKWFYILLSPLLALLVSTLLHFLMKSKRGQRMGKSIRIIAAPTLVSTLVALFFYIGLFNRSTFKFIHGDGTAAYYIKGDKASYSEAALAFKKDNPGISDDELISLGFVNPEYKKWAWSEESINNSFLLLVAGFSLVVVLLSGFVSFVVEYLAQRRARRKLLFATEEADDGKTHVFISYSHADIDTALKLKSLLEAEGIAVIIDSDSMLAGEAINDFIYRAIAASQVTIAIVSQQSLFSSWVALETVGTFFLERFSHNKHFVACVRNHDLYEASFAASIVSRVDVKLAELETEIQKQNALRMDTRNLNNDKSRLLFLRNNIDEIINRLKTCLNVDICSDDGLVKNVPLLLRSIKNYAAMAEAEEA